MFPDVNLGWFAIKICFLYFSLIKHEGYELRDTDDRIKGDHEDRNYSIFYSSIELCDWQVNRVENDPNIGLREKVCKYVYIFCAKGVRIEAPNDEGNSFGWLSEENMFSLKFLLHYGISIKYFAILYPLEIIIIIILDESKMDSQTHSSIIAIIL